MKVRFKMKIGNVEIEVEGEKQYVDQKIKELTKNLMVLKPQPEKSDISEELKTLPLKDDLKGIIEVKNDVPHITVSPKQLSLADTVALLLYASPKALTIKELKDLVDKNWKAMPVTSISAVIGGTLKGRIIKEGIHGKYIYSLSGAGQDFVRNKILNRFR